MIFKLGRLCALWSLGGGELYLWGMKLSHKLRAGILFKLLLHRNQHCAMNDTIYLEGFLSKDKDQGSRISDHHRGSRIYDLGSRLSTITSQLKLSLIMEIKRFHLVISDINQPSNLFVFVFYCVMSSHNWVHAQTKFLYYFEIWKANWCMIEALFWKLLFCGNHQCAMNDKIFNFVCKGDKPTHLIAPIHLQFHHSCCNLFCQSICCKIIWFNLPKSNVMNFHILWHWKLNNWFQLE